MRKLLLLVVCLLVSSAASADWFEDWNRRGQMDRIERMLKEQQEQEKYQPDSYCRAKVRAMTIRGTVCAYVRLRDASCFAAYQQCVRGYW